MPDSCTTCGWISAIVSCISFGSFAVPIKSKAAVDCNIDPLVFQSYKTFMCLVTSILTLPMFHQEFFFTWWGIVSGLFWVPAGVGAIYAVKNAGLALSQGLWSSFIVLVSFFWGIFIFQEKVKSRVAASFAVLIMIVGLWGMSYFSSPVKSKSEDRQQHAITAFAGDGSRSLGYEGIIETDGFEDYPSRANIPRRDLYKYKKRRMGMAAALFNGIWGWSGSVMGPMHYAPEDASGKRYVVIPRRDLYEKRRMGMAAALFNGIWGGSVMVPMHYAPEEASGKRYVVSFAIGASLITIVLWILRFSYNLYKTDMNLVRSYNLLPPLHLRVMWLPGGIAGTLWSIGNIASMISVQNLGEGVGYSVTQASMLCSGLWGIFYFREIPSRKLQMKWFGSAIITVAGILLLSYEHEE